MFTKINTTNGYMYKVDYTKERFDCANWAMETAIKKANYTTDTWQKRPNKYAKFVDIYYGDYAKNIVKSFIIAKNPELNLIEYDLIRTDNFHNHDLFDLSIMDNSIEIKSSLEKYTSDVNKIYNERRIIINVYGPHASLSDFVVQVFFIPSNLKHYEIIEEDNKLHPSILDEDVLAKCKTEVEYSLNSTTIYIAGWINKEQERNAISKAEETNAFVVSNSNTNAKKRTYANVFIKDSNPMDELIEALTNI